MLGDALAHQLFPLLLSAFPVQLSLLSASPDQILPHESSEADSGSHRSRDQRPRAHGLRERKRPAQPQPGEEGGEHTHGW